MVRAANFVVTNTNDTGAGSLRRAMSDANSNAGADNIVFNIPGTGPFKISVNTALPAMTDRVVIDGWSANGGNPVTNPKIEIDGSLTVNANGLEISASDCVIRGIAITGFAIDPGSPANGAGIKVNSGVQRCVIINNHIGVDPTGLIGRGNGRIGVWIDAGATNNRIGTDGNGTRDEFERNIIGANNRIAGVWILGNNNTVAGNYIGVGIDGVTPIPNNFDGVFIQGGASGNRIGTNGNGSSDELERNVISANAGRGIALSGAGSGNIIAGNYIGTTASGLSALGNSGIGVTIINTPGTRVGTDSSNDNFNASERNVISGNLNIGLNISGVLATGTIAAANFIGVGADGLTPLGNSKSGFVIADGASANLIGTNADASYDLLEANVISDNGGSGITLSFSGTTANVIAGNIIGKGADKTTQIPNKVHGVRVLQCNGNRIGSDLDGVRDIPEGNIIWSATEAGVRIVDSSNTFIARNLIVANHANGVSILGSSSRSNSILSNSIRSNGLLGIDLSEEGVTLNDGPLDPDVGPNDLQNFPVITNVTPAGVVTTTFNSAPNRRYRLEYFASDERDPSQYGEGDEFLGFVNVNTNANGDPTAPIVFSFTPIDGKPWITATATEIPISGPIFNSGSALAGTSEFSRAHQLPGQPPAAVDDQYSVAEDAVLIVQIPGLLGNDSNPGTGALQAQDFSTPSRGTLVPNSNGSFTYTPNLNFNGSDSFTYRARNSNNQISNVATAHITVTPRNDPPIAVNDTYITDEDVALTMTAPGILTNDTDVDNDARTAVLLTATTNGSLTLNPNGSFTYTPNPNFNGQDSFTYRAADALSQSLQTATVTITVKPVNDPPIAVDDAYATNEDTPLLISAANGVLRNDSDPDRSSLIALQISAPASGVLTFADTGAFTYTPPANFTGQVSLEYRAMDVDSLESNVATATITVNPVNDPPVVQCRDVVLNAATECISDFTITPLDVDGGSFDPDDPRQTLMLSVNATGPFPLGTTSVRLTVTDPHGAESAGVANVTVLYSDCNRNNIPDSCEFLAGDLTDCNSDGVPDECQCFWNNGAASATPSAVNGQISHLIPDVGMRAADDFSLQEGYIHKLNGFTGQMITNSIMLKAKLELYDDCNGKPGKLLYKFFNPQIADQRDIGDGYRFVTYRFDLCDQQIWLEGGAYWVSLIGLTDSQGSDISYWASVGESPDPHSIVGSVPCKSEAWPDALAGNSVALGEWTPVADCCLGCVNLAFKLTGESCPFIWDNSIPAMSGVYQMPDTGTIVNLRGGSPSGANGPWTALTVDNFVTKPCSDPIDVCYIETYVWTDCIPVNGFVELRAHDCKNISTMPTDDLVAQVSAQIPTGQYTIIDGREYQLFRLIFADLNWQLQPGTTYWIGSGVRPSGSFIHRSFFAYNNDCRAPCGIRLSPGQRTDFIPLPTNVWTDTGFDYAFRVAQRVPQYLVGSSNSSVSSSTPYCPTDVDQDGVSTEADIFVFLNAWFAGCP